MSQSTFNEAIQVLEAEWRQSLRQQEALLKYIGVSNPGLRRERLSREAHLRETIDQVCRTWVQTRKFPALRPDEAVFVYDRFEQAIVFAAWLRKHGVEFSQKSVEEILLFFLVDWWFFSGAERWHYRLKAGIE